MLLVFITAHFQIAYGNHMEAHRLPNRGHGTFQKSNLSGDKQFEHVTYEQLSVQNETQSTQSLYEAESVMCSPEFDCAAVAAQQRRTPAFSTYGVLAFLSVLAAGTAVRSLLVVRSKITCSSQRGGRTLRAEARPTAPNML